MIRTSTLALVLAMGAAGAAQATLSVGVTSAPTTDIAGFTTYTLNLSTDVSTVTSLDIDVDGPVNQVNPFTLATIFSDNNAVFVAASASVDQDSQFLFTTSGDSLLIATSNEDANDLSAAFTGFTAFTSRDVVQIVAADGEAVSYSITAVVNGEEEDIVGVVPEPSSLALLGLGGLLIARRRRG